MRTRRASSSLVALAIVLTAGAASAANDDKAASTEASRIGSRRLKLGLYGRPSPPQSSLQVPRFESSVDVLGEKPRSYNETMAVYWRHWQLSTGSIYGKGINIQNQGCPTCVNILPLIEAVVKKIKGK